MLGKFFKKPDPSLGDRVPPGQHLTEGFPVLTYGPTPEIDLETWQLKIWGLASPLVLSWSELMALPQQEFTADLALVSYSWRLETLQYKRFNKSSEFEANPPKLTLFQEYRGLQQELF